MKAQCHINLLLCVLAIVVLGSLNATAAQSLSQKGYQPLEAYSASGRLIVIPAYAADQTLCTISIQRKAFSEGVATVDLSMDSSEVEKVLSKLIPDAERGRPLNPSTGNLKLSLGNIVVAVSQYEHATITRYSGPSDGKSRLAAVVVHYKKASCADQ